MFEPYCFRVVLLIELSVFSVGLYLISIGLKNDDSLFAGTGGVLIGLSIICLFIQFSAWLNPDYETESENISNRQINHQQTTENPLLIVTTNRKTQFNNVEQSQV